MRTLIDLERLSTDRLVLRVRREDERGNVSACAAVDGTADQVLELAERAARKWAQADEALAQARKRRKKK